MRQGAVLAALLCIASLAPAQTTARSDSLSSPKQGAAQSQGERDATRNQPPPYSNVRWDEDYSYLRDPARRTDYLDPLKYMPLNKPGDWYVSLGGQIRDRYEYFNHLNFGGGPQDHDGYNLFRFLPYVDVHMGEHVRVFAQFRTVIESGREGGPRGRDMDTADLQQGFLQFDWPLPFGDDHSGLTLRAGRQQMVFGRERLIGISEWSNAQRNYDAVRVTLNSPHNSLDLFYFRPVMIEKYEFDDNDGRMGMAGVYDTLDAPAMPKGVTTKLSLYGFALNTVHKASWPANPGKGSENRYTLGSELTGNIGHADYDVEADYQIGNFKSQAITAFSVAAEGGYTFTNLCFTPRPFLGFDLATGDHNPNNGHLGTFNQLFPSGHTFFGYMDYLGRENIIDLHSGLEMTLARHHTLAEKVSLKGEYHEFWRDSTHDAIFDTSGAVFRSSGTSTAAHIGGELDLLLNWQFTRHVSSYFGYSHFFAGSFINQSGASKESDFAYAAMIYTF
jgi:hypothetical protein